MINLSLNKKRLKYLIYKLDENIASAKEKEEYLSMLYNDGVITQKEHEHYKKNFNATEIQKEAIRLGARTLVAIALAKLI